MSTLLNTLPGFQVTPPGVERKILRIVPALLGLGSFVILLPSLLMRVLADYGYIVEISAPSMRMIDILVFGVLVVYWLTIFTITIGAVLVSMMKGPAYVADGYEMEDID